MFALCGVWGRTCRHGPLLFEFRGRGPFVSREGAKGQEQALKRRASPRGLARSRSAPPGAESRLRASPRPPRRPRPGRSPPGRRSAPSPPRPSPRFSAPPSGSALSSRNRRRPARWSDGICPRQPSLESVPLARRIAALANDHRPLRGREPGTAGTKLAVDEGGELILLPGPCLSLSLRGRCGRRGEARAKAPTAAAEIDSGFKWGLSSELRYLLHL